MAADGPMREGELRDKDITPEQAALVERFNNLNLMHVMDDSLSYIEEISKKFDGNLDKFL